MSKEIKSILKIDCDLKDRKKVIKQIRYGLYFLQDIKLLNLKDIIKIEFLLKTNYSVKIYLSKEPKDVVQIILLQAILGDDRKRVGICYRDYLIGIKEWNRLFNMKQYSDGSIVEAIVSDVTEEIFEIKNEKK